MQLIPQFLKSNHDNKHILSTLHILGQTHCKLLRSGEEVAEALGKAGNQMLSGLLAEALGKAHRQAT